MKDIWDTPDVHPIYLFIADIFKCPIASRGYPNCCVRCVALFRQCWSLHQRMVCYCILHRIRQPLFPVQPVLYIFFFSYVSLDIYFLVVLDDKTTLGHPVQFPATDVINLFRVALYDVALNACTVSVVCDRNL